jgi:8-oxo-dGTP pyrophosphatase MutT (NUDIX family)
VEGPARGPRPKDAATLIIIDRSRAAAPWVLLGKRHGGHAFMPGKYVFPGGRVEREDRRMSVAEDLHPVIEAKLNARVSRPSPGFARALALAAIRETFEEAGLAIGVEGAGAPYAPPGAWTRFAATGVKPALAEVDFLIRAVTPPGRSRRFDARFFVVDAGRIAKRVDGVVHAEAELVDLVWTPLDKARELDLPHITRTALGELAAALARGLERDRPRPFYRELRGKGLREEV